MEKHASCKKTTIAGQALIEGILMRGPRKTAVVCRRPGEEPAVKLEPTGTMSHGALARIPVIRGVVSFWDSMRLGIRALTLRSSKACRLRIFQKLPPQLF